MSKPLIQTIVRVSEGMLTLEMEQRTVNSMVSISITDGEELHHYAMTPEFLSKLQQAITQVLISGGFEPVRFGVNDR